MGKFCGYEHQKEHLFSIAFIVALFYIVPVFDGCAFFFVRNHFTDAGKSLYFVGDERLQAGRNVIVVMAMQSNALLALSMPITQCVWA